jgi:predicted ATPase/DNA-binding SARP family transcriptional activator
MPSLELMFLGGFEVRLDGQPVIGFESDKSRLLMAYLAIESPRSQRRESLAGLFWSESPEKRARQSLSQALYNLRHILGQAGASECLEITPQDVGFHQRSHVHVDVHCFLAQIKEILQHPHPAVWACRACQERLVKAAGLYQGELLAGFSLPDAPEFETWLREQRHHLQEQARYVFSELVRSLVKRGERARALAYVERLVELDPYDETNQRLWISLLAQTGRRSKALEQVTVLEHMLEEELRMEPEAETVALADQIRQKTGAYQSESQPKHNLPTLLTAFVGREKEMDDLYWKLLDPGCRLLTLLGLGGSGKTRLALEAGRKILPAFPDGVFLVELGVLSSPHDLVPAIARTLGVRPKSIKAQPQRDAQVQELVDFLNQKELLFILDSAEMVIEGAHILSDLLQSVPGLALLATSRARLNLTGENLFQLQGLYFPPDCVPGWGDFPAVQLFFQAARRANPDFQLKDEDAGSIVQICQTLQGMPLAILLAAAWTSAMPPERILQEIQSSLEFLAGGWQDLPPRQKSLQAAFDYSWNLLWEEERALLSRLSIFRQPFSDNQAKEVAAATPNALKALLDFSLLQRTAQNRLRLHDLVRQFAQAKLMESPEESLLVHTRLGELYLRRLSEWDVVMKSARQVAAIRQMDLEIENARLAWDWLIQQEPQEGLGHALEGALENAHEGLCNYYDRRGQYSRGESACQDALNWIEERGLSASSLRFWARISAWQGHFWIALGRSEEGFTLLNRIITELKKEHWLGLDTRWEQAQALIFILLAKVRLENEIVIEYAKHSADLFLACDDRWYAARALVYGAAALESLGRYDEQIQTAERALELQIPDGDPELVHYIHYVLGCGYIYRGDHEIGARIIDESITPSSAQDEKMEIAEKMIHKAVNYILMGNFKEALPSLEYGFSLHQELGRKIDDTNLVRYYSVHWGLGNYDRSIEIACQIKDAYARGMLAFLGSIYFLQGKVELAQVVIKDALQSAIETSNSRFIGFTQAFLSIACYLNCSNELALHYLQEALVKSQTGSTIETGTTLLAVAFFLAEGGDAPQAVEVFTAATQIPFIGKSAWTHDFLGKRIESLSERLPGEMVAAARARGQEHSLQELVEEWSQKVDQLTIFNK